MNGSRPLFRSSLRTDETFVKFYQEAVDKVGPPLSRTDKKHDYKLLYFEVLDSIVGMLNEGFQDMKRFAFSDLVNPKVFTTWDGQVPPEKINQLKEMYVPCLMYQCLRANFLLFTGIMTSIKTPVMKYKNIYLSLIFNLEYQKL